MCEWEGKGERSRKGENRCTCYIERKKLLLRYIQRERKTEEEDGWGKKGSKNG